MPNLATHAEVVKPLAGGSTSFFAGLLLEYLGVTTPIFVAASFGAIVAVIMLGKFKPLEAFGYTVKPSLVALLVSITGGIAACYGFHLIEPFVGMELPQTPATMALAFTLVYFLPLLLDVARNRIEGFKK